jgi:hypothetical protein
MSYDTQIKCPECGWYFQRLIAEHCEDTHCRNPDCYPRKVLKFSPHVRIRDGWWFAVNYSIPFRINDAWYCVYSSDVLQRRYNATILGEFFLTPHTNMFGWNLLPSRWETKQVLSLPFYALPVNQDFEFEFDSLRVMCKKLMMLQ